MDSQSDTPNRTRHLVVVVVVRVVVIARTPDCAAVLRVGAVRAERLDMA
ncbi:hypothetical protein [Lysobacter fragariae]